MSILHEVPPNQPMPPDAVVTSLPVTATTVVTLQMPGDLARTISVNNRSHLWVYVNASSAEPVRAGLSLKSVPPYTSSVFPCGATRYATFLVDVGPDGSVGATGTNEQISVALSPLPSPAGQDVPIGGATNTQPAANVTVTQLPAQAALADALANPSTTGLEAFLAALNAAGTWDRLRADGDNADAVLPAGLGVLRTLGFGYVWNTVTGGWDRQRAVTTFKNVSTAAIGSTALWTPAAGKKFRLMRYRLSITGDSRQSVSGDITVSLLDGAGSINQSDAFFVSTTSLNWFAGYTTGWIDLQQGILSAAANNVLNLNLSAALTGGQVVANACGTEE